MHTTSQAAPAASGTAASSAPPATRSLHLALLQAVRSVPEPYNAPVREALRIYEDLILDISQRQDAGRTQAAAFAPDDAPYRLTEADYWALQNTRDIAELLATGMGHTANSAEVINPQQVESTALCLARLLDGVLQRTHYHLAAPGMPDHS